MKQISIGDSTGACNHCPLNLHLFNSNYMILLDMFFITSANHAVDGGYMLAHTVVTEKSLVCYK